MQKGGAPLRDAPPFSPLSRTSFRRPGRRRCLLLRRYYDPVAADRHDTEVIATVLLPAGFVMLGANRALLAIAHEVEAICRNAVVNEVPLGACRTALAEGQVVLVGATLVSVTLDTNSHSGVGLQPRNLSVECCSCIRSDRRLVEVEVDRGSDRGGVNHGHYWRNASRIRRQDVRVVLANCRWRRRWGRRRRSNAVRARSGNALETGVRAHHLRTRTTKQQAQAATNVEVEVRAWLVIRHVVNDTVDAKCRAIRDAETNAGESAHAKVVAVTVRRRIGAALELVTGASSAGADDKLALAASDKVADREVVVQAGGERMRVDVRRASRDRSAVRLRRIVAIAFDFPARIAEEDAKASAIADSVLGNRVGDSGVVVEVAPLNEAAEFNGSGKRRDELIPPNVGRPHDRIASCATAEKIVDVRRKLQPGLGAEIELPAVGRQVVDESVNAERNAAQAEIESDESVGAKLINSATSVGASAKVLESSASSNVDRWEIPEWEAVHETSSERARLHISRHCIGGRAQEARSSLGLGGRVPAVSFDVPVRRDESTNTSTVTPGISEAGVKIPFAIEVRPRAETPYQQ